MSAGYAIAKNITNIRMNELKSIGSTIDTSIILNDNKNNAIKLSKILTDATLIYFFSDKQCSDCIKEQLKIIKKIARQIIPIL